MSQPLGYITNTQHQGVLWYIHLRVLMVMATNIVGLRAFGGCITARNFTSTKRQAFWKVKCLLLLPLIFSPMIFSINHTLEGIWSIVHTYKNTKQQEEFLYKYICYFLFVLYSGQNNNNNNNSSLYNMMASLSIQTLTSRC